MGIALHLHTLYIKSLVLEGTHLCLNLKSNTQQKLGTGHTIAELKSIDQL
jgi:hypothetical protein